MKKIIVILVLHFSALLMAKPVRLVKPFYSANNTSCLVNSSFNNSIYTIIPDPAFEQALIDLGYDTVIDGKVLTENISSVDRLVISSLGIKDLTGIKAFTSLNTLSCSMNPLTNLDVSGLTSLFMLDISGNELTSLNIKGCSSLNMLYCYYNKLVSIDFSGCTSIQDLGLSYNQLTSIDVSGLTSLYALAIDGNQLTSLDVSGMTSLNTLTCSFNKLKSLNVNGCTSLVYLMSYDNQLTSLDLSGIYPGDFNFTNNKLDCIKLDEIQLKFQMFQDTRFYGKDSYTGYTSTSCHQTSIPDSIFEQTLIDMGYDTIIDGKVITEVVSKIIYLDIPNRGIKDLTGIQVFTSMTDLYCANNQLTNLDVSGLTSLMTLDCPYNQLKNLNVSGCDSLIAIYSNDNLLPSIDVSMLTTLQVLYCENNKLTTLNSSGNTNLDYLNCNNNQLISLNLTGCINLTQLYCNNNQFLSIDVRDFPALRDFQAQSKYSTTAKTKEVLYTTLDCTSNPNLNCIRVSEETLANSNPNWTKEEKAVYATTLCNEQQTYCYGSRISNLVPSGTSVKWYIAPTGGNALTPTTLLTSGAYYMTQTTNGVVSERIPVVVTINPKSVAGSIIGASGILCYNSDKTLILNAARKGNIQWQSGPTSTGLFTDIDGAITNSLNTGNLTASTYFRAVVTNDLCSSVNTAPVKVTVQLRSEVGTISGGDVTVCPGINSSKLTLSSYLGQIQWQYSKDNSRFHNITIKGTGSSYTAKNLKSTTYYRAVITKGTASCTPAISESVVINVNTPINAGTVSGTDLICFGTAASLTVSGYDEGASIEWQKSSILTGTYANITTGIGFTTDNYTSTSLTTSSYYRAKVTFNGCSSLTAPFLVTVKKAIAGKITGGTISSGTVCTGIPTMLTLTGYIGTNIQWLSSKTTTSTSFTPISGANSNTYEASNATIGKNYYKASLAYPGCNPVFTPIIYVSVADCSFNKFESSTNKFEAMAYPNPFSNSFMIDLKTPSQELIQLSVYDLQGRIIEKRIINPSKISTLKTGDSYSSGIYNVILRQATDVKRIRIIKR